MVGSEKEYGQQWVSSEETQSDWVDQTPSKVYFTYIFYVPFLTGPSDFSPPTSWHVTHAPSHPLSLTWLNLLPLHPDQTWLLRAKSMKPQHPIPDRDTHPVFQVSTTVRSKLGHSIINNSSTDLPKHEASTLCRQSCSLE